MAEAEASRRGAAAAASNSNETVAQKDSRSGAALAGCTRVQAGIIVPVSRYAGGTANATRAYR